VSAFTARLRRLLLGPDEHGPSMPDTDDAGRVQAIRPPDPFEPAAQAEADADPVPYDPYDPDAKQAAADVIATFGHARPHPATDRLGDPMPETRYDDDPSADADYQHTDLADTDPRMPAPNLTDQLADSGVHHVDGDYQPPTLRFAIQVERPVNDLLRESIALIPEGGGDMVIKEFYTRLLHAAPGLIPLFPRDLLVAATQDGGSRGALQRERLLAALIGLSELYGGSQADMDHLNNLLAKWGREHASFTRPDGTVSGATPEEYLAVKQVLFGTLVDVAGGQWRVEYTQAWSQAYDHAMVMMLHAQHTSGMTSARHPRRDAHREHL
jgi:hemoglobin-like flavoprotein